MQAPAVSGRFSPADAAPKAMIADNSLANAAENMIYYGIEWWFPALVAEVAVVLQYCLGKKYVLLCYAAGGLYV